MLYCCTDCLTHTVPNALAGANKKKVVFYVLFLQIGVHSPLQSKEQTSQTKCICMHICVHMYTHTYTYDEFKDASVLDDLTLLGRLFQTDSEHKKKISDQVSACTQEEEEEWSLYTLATHAGVNGHYTLHVATRARVNAQCT